MSINWPSNKKKQNGGWYQSLYIFDIRAGKQSGNLAPIFNKRWQAKAVKLPSSITQLARWSTTYLGVEISNNLNWSPHIDKIVKKRNKSLGFVRCNTRTSSSNVKPLAYTALVIPILEYSCQVCDPHTNKDIQKIESVQCRAARYATNRYHNTSSPIEMIRNLGLDSLKQRHAKIRLATLYKIMLNLVEIPRDQFLLPSTSTYQSHCLNFQRPTTSTNYLKYSFFPRTTAQWNSLI